MVEPKSAKGSVVSRRKLHNNSFLVMLVSLAVIKSTMKHLGLSFRWQETSTSVGGGVADDWNNYGMIVSTAYELAKTEGLGMSFTRTSI